MRASFFSSHIDRFKMYSLRITIRTRIVLTNSNLIMHLFLVLYLNSSSSSPVYWIYTNSKTHALPESAKYMDVLILTYTLSNAALNKALFPSLLAHFYYAYLFSPLLFGLVREIRQIMVWSFNLILIQYGLSSLQCLQLVMEIYPRKPQLARLSDFYAHSVEL